MELKDIQKDLRMLLIQNCNNPVLFDLVDHDLNLLDKEIEKLQKAINDLEIYKKETQLLLEELSKYEYNDVNLYETAKLKLESEKK